MPRTNNILGMLRGMRAVDEGLGKILDYLDQANLASNTIVIFTSDNGSYLGSHTFYDKRLGYEAALRIPFVLRYPAKVPAGSRMTEMGVNVDTAQTLLDWAGVSAPAYQQGRSLTAGFEGRSTTPREDFLAEYYVDDHYPYAGTNMVAVRTPDWKLVQAEDAKPENTELYDLKKDPAELNNLASDPARAPILRDMLDRLTRLKEETRFTWDRDWRRREIVEQEKRR
jgi:N-acetylglucosamine-6-sulfatase